MAEILLQNAFKFAALTLNYVSPSILADVILHPFDFATVLLQIGYNPEGIKDETVTFVSVIVQYALFTLYIPYLLTSMQGLQIMGMPHPSIFYYIIYIYRKEGFGGCYRGLTPKIIERLVMIHINDSIKQVINKGPGRRNMLARINRDQLEEDQFLRSLINNICCQFFAVLASHPFHVIMITSFADFVYNRKNTFFELAVLIYKRDGYYGFTIGLAPRLVGELLSLIFSMVYTRIITKQMSSGYEEAEDGNASRSGVSETYYLSELNSDPFQKRHLSTRRDVAGRRESKKLEKKEGKEDAVFPIKDRHLLLLAWFDFWEIRRKTRGAAGKTIQGKIVPLFESC